MRQQLLSRILSLLVALTLVAGFSWVCLLRSQVVWPRSVASQLNEAAAVMDGEAFLLLGGVNLNTADSLALQEIPGIGPVLARRIVEYRRINGAFSSVEQLDAVQGIGGATLAKIAHLGYVDELPQPGI